MRWEAEWGFGIGVFNRTERNGRKGRIGFGGINHKGHKEHIVRRFGIGELAAKDAKGAKKELGISPAKALSREG